MCRCCSPVEIWRHYDDFYTLISPPPMRNRHWVRDRGATLRLGEGGAPLVTWYWVGGHKSLFLLTLYNFKNIGGGTSPPPPPAVPVGTLITFPDTRGVSESFVDNCFKLMQFTWNHILQQSHWMPHWFDHIYHTGISLGQGCDLHLHKEVNTKSKSSWIFCIF